MAGVGGHNPVSPKGVLHGLFDFLPVKYIAYLLKVK
jgi:hypothetical protein